MILAGQIDKIEGQKVWVLVSPDGVGCGNNCTCERPVRKIEARTAEDSSLELGETVIVTTKKSAGLGILLALGAIGGGLLSYELAQTVEPTVRAAVAIGGAFAGGIITSLLLSVFRGSQFPQVKKIRVQLHTNDS